MFSSPRLPNNRITCQSSHYRYTLPLPPDFAHLSTPPQQGLQITIIPPPPAHPNSPDLWADCTPTSVLVQSDYKLPLPIIDNHTQLPAPNTWLHSLHQLLAQQAELASHATPQLLEDLPCLTDPNSFLQLNAFPHGHCYDPHVSLKPTSITLSLSPSAFTAATHTASLLIDLPYTETRRGQVVPKQLLVSIRPAHRSILGPAQTANPIFSAPPLPDLPPLAWSDHTGLPKSAQQPSRKLSLPSILRWVAHILSSGIAAQN